MTMLPSDFDSRAVAAIQGIALDGPHAARSGHQGTAMALAPLAHVLYTRIMTFDPTAPHWPNRDRFVLSAGHASILQYALLYLCGFGLTIDDLRDFRQWASATPGHPEVGHTPGVEATTGPLGQGLATAVGMALAEERSRARSGSGAVDHFTYVVCSDGDLAEGVSHEAASLAGHLGLARLICVYDDNRISIDGPTDIWLSDDPKLRFESYGWHVLSLDESAGDLDEIEAALHEAKQETKRPTMIVLRTHIGSPHPTLSDTSAAHGYAFGQDEIAETKRLLGLDPDETFQVEPDVLAEYRARALRNSSNRGLWEKANPRPPSTIQPTATKDLVAAMATFTPGESVATRVASNHCLNDLIGTWPSMVVGSADLTGSTGTQISQARPITRADRSGNQIFYGVREHAMAAIMNGLALHGTVLPIGGTFLVFSDYARPAIRLAALSKLKVIYSFTHDSVGVGEDGPTHQPIEQVSALRAIPGLTVIRPADATETAGAWAAALSCEGPIALILSRQGLTVLEESDASSVLMGAYALTQVQGPDLILMSSGSEVGLCIAAARRLQDDGYSIRVVSVPSWELFELQDPGYRLSLIEPEVPALAVEAGVAHGWHKYADETVSIEGYGASAPGPTVMHELGMNVNNIVDRASAILSRPRAGSSA